MIEMENAMENMKITSPIELIYTDGGGDHRTPFVSVQKGYIAHFLKMDLDMLVAARTPSYFSVVNPVERAMCVINLALNGLLLDRKRFSDKFEKKIKPLSSKKKWRKAQVAYMQGEPNATDFSKIVNQATEGCVGLIEEGISQLKYKDEQFRIGKKATEDELTDLMTHLQNIDESIDWSDDSLTKRKL